MTEIAWIKSQFQDNAGKDYISHWNTKDWAKYVTSVTFYAESGRVGVRAHVECPRGCTKDPNPKVKSVFNTVCKKKMTIISMIPRLEAVILRIHGSCFMKQVNIARQHAIIGPKAAAADAKAEREAKKARWEGVGDSPPFW